MSSSPFEIAIIGIGGTIAGTLIGAWLGYRFSLNLTNIIERRRAKLQLQQAFKDEILTLDPTQHALKMPLPDFLENAFSKHRGAVFDYSYFLRAKTKTKFLEAWYEYYCHEDKRNGNCVPFFEQYSLQGKTLEEEHEIKKLVRDRINKILKFAKYE